MKNSVTQPRLSSAKWLSAVVWLSLLAVTIGFQWSSGAYRSDFGGHSDEGAHVVTSLMMRDYFAGGFLEEWHPVRYAENYYERFPKVALGHYPPGFYLLAGLWMLPVRNGTAILLMMAALTTTGGWLTWRAGRHLLPETGALAAGLLFCVLPLTRIYTAIVMADVMLACLCLGAAMAFARFLESASWRHSLVFGLLAAAAILTKASGLFLALIPPVAILLTGRWRLLRDWRLWIAPIPVLLLALPWLLFTRHITAEGMRAMPPAEYFLEAIRYYPAAFVKTFGYAAALFLIAALTLETARCIRGRRPFRPVSAVHAALVFSWLVLFCAVPSGFDARYLLPLIPSAILLTISTGGRSGRVAAVIALVVLVESWQPKSKVYSGASTVMQHLLAEAENTGPIPVLISSGSNGEGALTAAACFADPNRFRIFRSSKVLATSDWLGRDYQARFETADALTEYLRSASIHHLVLDGGIHDSQIKSHHRLLSRTVEIPGSGFSLIATIPSRRKNSPDSTFAIYRLQAAATPENHLNSAP